MKKFIRHKFGRTFTLEEGGSPVKAPLIFLHGGPGGRHESIKSILEISKSRRVIVYDQIGGGKSDLLPQNQMKISTFVDELGLIIDALKLKHFHLGGSSWGATLALEYYLNRRDSRIKSLIFASPMFSANHWKRDAKTLISKLPSKYKKIIRFCHEIGATDSKVYGQAMLEYYVRHVLRNRKKLLAQNAENAAGRGNPGKSVYEFMWGPSEFEPTGTLKIYNRVPELKTIHIPTLLTCGEYDEAKPSTIRTYHQLIQGSRFKIISGCSHAILLEKPRLLLREIEEFLETID